MEQLPGNLKTLERTLRKKGLPQLGASTIREVLHETGYSFQQTRTWCRTGYAERVRKSGTVTVYDPEMDGVKRLIELACEQAEAAGIVQLNEDEAGPYQAIPQPGSGARSQKAILPCILMNTPAEARRNC
jgi:hypothetical protein